MSIFTLGDRAGFRIRNLWDTNRRESYPRSVLAAIAPQGHDVAPNRRYKVVLVVLILVGMLLASAIAIWTSWWFCIRIRPSPADERMERGMSSEEQGRVDDDETEMEKRLDEKIHASDELLQEAIRSLSKSEAPET